MAVSWRMDDLERLDVIVDLACCFARPLGHRDTHVFEATFECVPDHFSDEGEYSRAVARYLAEEAWDASGQFLVGQLCSLQGE